MRKKFLFAAVILSLSAFFLIPTPSESQLFQKNPPVLNFEKGRDITQRYWICSIEKAKRDFSYSQQISIEDGIRETVEWYKEHKWL